MGAHHLHHVVVEIGQAARTKERSILMLVGRVVENEPLPLSPPLRGERSGEGLG
jgi:hypothetical protein